MSELLDCPFCGGEAESDAYQSYRSLSSGKTGTRAVIYCTCCSADIGLCREDYFGDEREGLTEAVREAWNRRAPSVQNAELQARAERAEAAIAWANNSLFGAHGFFLSTNGGPPDEHHLDRAIENLKAEAERERDRAYESMRAYARQVGQLGPDLDAARQEASSLRQALAAATGALEPFARLEQPPIAFTDCSDVKREAWFKAGDLRRAKALTAGPAQPLGGGENGPVR